MLLRKDGDGYDDVLTSRFGTSKCMTLAYLSISFKIVINDDPHGIPFLWRSLIYIKVL